MLWHIFYLLLAFMAADIVIMFSEVSKGEKEKSTVAILLAFVIFMGSLFAVIIISGVAQNTDINMTNLDSGEIYYLNAKIPIPDNAQSVGLVVVRLNIPKQKLHGPIILAAVNKELISSNVKEGDYIIKNSQGKIESWDPPNKN